MNAAMQRREVRYQGHVQGVGFRYTTHRIARRFAVTGFVENLPDGSVQVVVEGTADQVDTFLNEVADAMQGYIQNVQQDTLAPSGEFLDFRIRH